MKNKKLLSSFYQGDDVVSIARDLLGKKLCTFIDGQYASAMIVETEAYRAPEDPASHAFRFRRTARTEAMFATGGTSYVYLIYGMYRLMNVVTNIEDIPHAVLIRGVQPLEGIDTMLRRRNMATTKPGLTTGPGLLSMAMGIGLHHSGLSLLGDAVWIESNVTIEPHNIIASPRVGMGKNVFEPYYSIPWRFRVKDNEWVSPAK